MIAVREKRKFDAGEVRQAAAGRWKEILSHLGGLSSYELSGKHCPCPRCDGIDRFRFIDEEAGAVFCNKCFSTGNGSGFDALMWLNGWTFPASVREVAEYVGVQSKAPRVKERYSYQDESGSELFQSVRYEPKDFEQGHFVDGEWIGNIEGVRRVLYRLPTLVGLPPGTTVFVCEGEKDVEALEKLGLVATCNPMGAKKWKKDYSPFLAGHHVVILEDNDDDGRKHARIVLDALKDIAASVKIVRLPGLPTKGDTYDYLKTHTKEQFLDAVKAAGKSASRTAIITKLSSVTPTEIGWLWPNRLPLGKLSLIIGDPGLGKSYLSLDLASRVSQGWAFPDEGKHGVVRKPGGVILLGSEDDLADTIKPRLNAAGADCERIVALQGIRIECDGQSEQASFSLVNDLPAMEQAMEELGSCGLIVIDPIEAYLGRTDSHKSAEVRSALMPLAELAAKHGVAVVGICHLNKASGKSAIYRTTGSLAFVAAARSTWAVVKDKSDNRKRLFLPVKCNLSEDIEGLSFRIADGTVAWDAEPVKTTADRAMDDSPDASAEEEAAAWLRATLMEGDEYVKQLMRGANEAGHSWSTVKRAKHRMKVTTYKEGWGSAGSWKWSLSVAS